MTKAEFSLALRNDVKEVSEEIREVNELVDRVRVNRKKELLRMSSTVQQEMGGDHHGNTNSFSRRPTP